MKRSLIIIAALFLLSAVPGTAIHAESGKQKRKSRLSAGPAKPRYDRIERLNSRYARVERDGKWGYLDTWALYEVIPPRYDEVSALAEPGHQLLRVKKNGKWGYVSFITGEEVVAPKYDEAGEYLGKDSLFGKVRLNGKWGYIDQAGAEIIPLKYDEVGPISTLREEGPVAFRGDNDKWGFSEAGRVIVSPRYDVVRPAGEGFQAAGVKTGAGSDDVLFGFVDSSGREIVSPRYSRFEWFNEGMAAVAVMAATNPRRLAFGFIDRTGREIVPPRYDDVKYFHEGLASVVSGGKWSVVDKKGRELFPPCYSFIGSFSEGMAVVMKFTGPGEKLYGFIDKRGKQVIPLQYRSATRFARGRAKVNVILEKPSRRTGGTFRYMLIDRKGRPAKGRLGAWDAFILNEPVVSRDKHRFGVKVRIGDKWGYADSTGREIVAVKYDEVPDSLSLTFNRIKRNGKYGYVDLKGREVVPPRYDEAPVRLYEADGPSRAARVKTGSKYGYLSRDTGEEIVPLKYDYAPEHPAGERTKVKRDGKWGYIDRRGGEVSEFRHEDDPCTFGKKGEHYVFGEQADMRSRPDPASDVITRLAAGSKIHVGSSAETEFTAGDVVDTWYKATSGDERGYVWGGDLADSAFTVFTDGRKLLFLIRNRTNGTDHCSRPRFEMKMLGNGKVLSEYSGHPFDKATSRVTSLKYVSLKGFSAPLRLLKVRFDFTGYKDAYARFGTAESYFYIDDGKLNNVLDVAEVVRGEGKFKDHKFISDLELPGKTTGKDTIIYTVYSSRGFKKELFSRQTYQWGWAARAFKESR